MKTIKYISFCENNGYGNSAKAYIKGLLNYGVNVSWMPLRMGKQKKLGLEKSEMYRSEYEGFEEQINRKLDYDTVIVHTVPEYFPLLKKLEPNKKIIGYTVWETDKIPLTWETLLEIPDLLFVPSQFTKKVFIESGVKTPITLIPHVADISSTSSAFLSKSDEQFTFYCIESYTNRKAIWDLVSVYCQTFSKRDNVILIIKTSKTDFTKASIFRRKHYARNAIKKIQKKFIQAPAIKVIDEELSDEEIHSLHKKGDCYISLTRSEGFGLSPFNACLHGNPVIITGWGGQLAYLGQDYPLLINYNLISAYDPRAPDIYSSDQKWGKADLNHASKLMRQVFENKHEYGNKLKALQEINVEQFSEERIIKKILISLQALFH
ncbi:MAG: glycosyltransferase family 1 protein [Pseudomonadota bacterium]